MKRGPDKGSELAERIPSCHYTRPNIKVTTDDDGDPTAVNVSDYSLQDLEANAREPRGILEVDATQSYMPETAAPEETSLNATRELVAGISKRIEYIQMLSGNNQSLQMGPQNQ
eukprot:1409561-Pyramimonas_sp.AAC.1